MRRSVGNRRGRGGGEDAPERRVEDRPAPDARTRSGLGAEASDLEPTGDSSAAGRVLDLDGETEQVPERPESPKQWKAKAGVNLRKSLAWDNIFFTSEGRNPVDKNADDHISGAEVKEIIMLSASANKLSRLKQQAEEYAALIPKALATLRSAKEIVHYSEPLRWEERWAEDFPD